MVEYQNQNDLNEWYFSKLKELVGNSEYYNHMLRGLYSREFYSPLDLDSGRASYGLWFRKRYLSEEESAALGPCRVLEMIIALAEQIDTHSEMGNVERIQRYFWMMLENLDMLGFTDFSWGQNSESLLNNKIDILLDRRYGEDGKGSLFPLQEYPINPVLLNSRERTTMRSRDIWTQRCLFDVRAWERWKGLLQ